MTLRLATAQQHKAGPQGPYKPMRSDHTFEWRPCRRHPWLGVSVLVSSDGAMCFLEDGSEHPVELERAA